LAAYRRTLENASFGEAQKWFSSSFRWVTVRDLPPLIRDDEDSSREQRQSWLRAKWLALG
jgi:hypothetical protein